MGNIIDTEMTPRFKKGEIVAGTENGVDAVIKEIAGSWPGEYGQGTIQKTVGALRRALDWVGDSIYALFIPVLALIVRAFRRWKRNKPRVCPVDSSEMTRLDAAWDDNHLQKGQITEERLKTWIRMFGSAQNAII